MWLHLLAQNPSELAADELLQLVRATSKFVTSDLVAAIERVAPGGGSHAVEFLGVDSHHTDVRASHSFIAARWDAEDPVTSTPLRTLIFGVVLLKRRIRSLVATLNAVQAMAPSAPPLASAASATSATNAPSAPPLASASSAAASASSAAIATNAPSARLLQVQQVQQKCRLHRRQVVMSSAQFQSSRKRIWSGQLRVR